MKSMKNTIVSICISIAEQLLFDTKTFTFLQYRVYLRLMRQLSWNTGTYLHYLCISILCIYCYILHQNLNYLNINVTQNQNFMLLCDHMCLRGIIYILLVYCTRSPFVPRVLPWLARCGRWNVFQDSGGVNPIHT